MKILAQNTKHLNPFVIPLPELQRLITSLINKFQNNEVILNLDIVIKNITYSFDCAESISSLSEMDILPEFIRIESIRIKTSEWKDDTNILIKQTSAVKSSGRYVVSVNSDNEHWNNEVIKTVEDYLKQHTPCYFFLYKRYVSIPLFSLIVPLLIFIGLSGVIVDDTWDFKEIILIISYSFTMSTIYFLAFYPIIRLFGILFPTGRLARKEGIKKCTFSQFIYSSIIIVGFLGTILGVSLQIFW